MYSDIENPSSQGIENLSIFNCSPGLTSVIRSRIPLNDVINGKHKNFLMLLFFKNIIVNLINICEYFNAYSSFFFHK